MNTKKAIIAALPALLLCNCASIVSKSDYPVNFVSSKPTKFTVKERGTQSTVFSGTTPSTATLSASDGFFQPAKYDVSTSKGNQSLGAKVDPWIIGNLFNFSGIIGFAIDGASGAMWKLPKTMYIND